jgi:hypothetical protein
MVAHVACMGKRKYVQDFVGIPAKRNNLEDIDVDRSVILKQM